MLRTLLDGPVLPEAVPAATASGKWEPQRTMERWDPGETAVGLSQFKWPWGQNLWLHFGVDEHPFATYFDVHQGYRVLTHSQIRPLNPVSLWSPFKQKFPASLVVFLFSFWPTFSKEGQPFISESFEEVNCDRIPADICPWPAQESSS